jgi:hypothetical protein
MVVIFAGVLALGVFVAQCEAARRGSFSAHVGALVEGVLLLPLAGLGALLGLILWGMTCDEGCVENQSPDIRSAAPDWWNTQDAWQWPAQFFVAVAGFGMVCVACAAASDKRYQRAFIAMTLAAACFGAWAAFLAPLGNGLGI